MALSRFAGTPPGGGARGTAAASTTPPPTTRLTKGCVPAGLPGWRTGGQCAACALVLAGGQFVSTIPMCLIPPHPSAYARRVERRDAILRSRFGF